MTDIYSGYAYRDTAGYTADATLVGYDVEASDGSIGEVDEATRDTQADCLVVDTGPWIFGKKVMLPAGVVLRIDHEDKKVFVDRTKEQIKNSPEYDEDAAARPEYRTDLDTYYSGTYR